MFKKLDGSCYVSSYDDTSKTIYVLLNHKLHFNFSYTFVWVFNKTKNLQVKHNLTNK